jgi:hypothetical protein
MTYFSTVDILESRILARSAVRHLEYKRQECPTDGQTEMHDSRPWGRQHRGLVTTAIDLAPVLTGHPQA